MTILTAVYVALFRMPFVEAIATRKLTNVFLSAVAMGVFMWHGLVDYRLGLILSVATFVGALLGAPSRNQGRDAWLRRIFLTAFPNLGTPLKAASS